jgi:hypothetical protein
MSGITDVITTEDLSSNLDASDYIFVVDKHGQLKLLILSNTLETSDIHGNVLQLLNFFGIQDLETRTLH